MGRVKRWLDSADAEKYLAPFAPDFAAKGRRIGMDADRAVLTHGRDGKGGALFPGGRFGFVDLADDRGTVFVDGDLVVDAWAENAGGLVFVRGNLIARSLYNSGYLVVAGELRVDRFLGEDERYGTLVFGDAFVRSAVLARNHHFDAWGEASVDELVDGESDGETALRARLHAWGVLASPDAELGDAPRLGLREWAAGQGKLPEEWASRRWTPKVPPPPPEPAKPPPPPPRSPIVVELEAWLGASKLTQREQLAALESDWLQRIPEGDREEAKRVIKRAINSKKLIAPLEALLAKLG
jgi:hypothetical protein